MSVCKGQGVGGESFQQIQHLDFPVVAISPSCQQNDSSAEETQISGGVILPGTKQTVLEVVVYTWFGDNDYADNVTAFDEVVDDY